ncbi:MAG TPA: IclR family transcriptional regulator C-terminal domain-containing protein, partial [Paraburkholderia sp.]
PTVAALHELVRADAQRGYAIGQSTFESGISVVTAPVRNHTGRIAAVITATIPGSRIDPALLEGGLADKVRHAADQLSWRLNYRPDNRAQQATRASDANDDMKTLELQ